MCVGSESLQREDISLRLVLAVLHAGDEPHVCVQLDQHSIRQQQPIPVGTTVLELILKLIYFICSSSSLKRVS